MLTLRDTVYTRTLTSMPGKESTMQPIQKIGHYRKVCRSAKFLWQSQQITPQQNYPKTQEVRKVREKTNTQTIPNTNQDSQSDKNDDSIDLENTFFIQEIFKNSNTVKPNTFNNDKPAKYSPKVSDEIRICTTSDRIEIDWLADTGSPRSFINKEEADKILQNCKNSKWKNPRKAPRNIDASTISKYL